MGVGTPSDIVKCIAEGVDMFDCVLPTRNARNGQIFTYNGKVNILNAKYKNDLSPIDKNNNYKISQQYSKAYLHHLFNTREILGLRISTSHNLHFYINLMNRMRMEITQGTFNDWANNFLAKYGKID